MTTNPVMSITDEQIAEIEALAEHSTGGIWTYAEHDDCDYVEGPCSDFIGTADNVHDGYWMAAANPANILALISRLRAAERDAGRYRYVRLYPQVTQEDWEPIFLDCEDMDTAIDTAMKGDQQ